MKLAPSIVPTVSNKASPSAPSIIPYKLFFVRDPHSLDGNSSSALCKLQRCPFILDHHQLAKTTTWEFTILTGGSTSIMCQKSTYHFVCGHVSHRTIVQCPFSVAKLLAAQNPFTDTTPIAPILISANALAPRPVSPNSALTHYLCNVGTDEIEILDSFCGECKDVSIKQEWLAKEPEERFPVLRSWARQVKEGVKEEKEKWGKRAHTPQRDAEEGNVSPVESKNQEMEVPEELSDVTKPGKAIVRRETSKSNSSRASNSSGMTLKGRVEKLKNRLSSASLSSPRKGCTACPGKEENSEADDVVPQLGRLSFE